MGEGIECIKDMLEKHGISYTAQREEIMSLFIIDPKHYKADEVFKIVRHKGIGIATVYRTLELLKNCGILKEISIGKERFYELKKESSMSIYGHFKCVKCGAFFDYYDAESVKQLASIAESAQEKLNFKVNDITITVNGVCRRCSGAETGKAQSD